MFLICSYLPEPYPNAARLLAAIPSSVLLWWRLLHKTEKKSRGPTEESRPKQNLLVHPRSSTHRQADAIVPAASSTLERAPELIDGKVDGLPLRTGCSNLIGRFIG